MNEGSAIRMFKKLEIVSWKKALISALLQALLAVIICIIYSNIIAFLTGGQEFVGKVDQHKEINGIRQDVVLVICGVLSATIPILLLRYKRIKHLLLYVLATFLFYVSFVAFVVLCIDDVVYNIFDYILNAITAVPIGLLVGIAVVAVFNKNKK